MSPLSRTHLSRALALTLLSLLSAGFGQDGRTGGLTGAFHDAGSGVLVSATPGAGMIRAVFQVGREGQAPFAREQVTLAPSGKRSAQTLSVTSGLDVKRTGIKVPGGLGAFWELDLQNEESGILREVMIEIGGTPVRAVKMSGGQADFVLPSTARAPYRVAFRFEFFKRTETFRFDIGEDGRAVFNGTGSETAATGIKDLSAARDPKLPPRNRPRDPFAATLPGPNGGSAPRSRLRELTAPAGWEARRGTWLTPTEIKERPQDLGGLWIDADSSSEPELQWFDLSPGRLRVGSAANRGKGYGVDVTPAGAGSWRGRVFTCPIPEGTCPNLCRWDSGEMRIDADNLHAAGSWRGKKSKQDCSGYTEEPSDGPLAYKRFSGVRFVPLLPGKYIHLVAAPAVGNQAAQFKAAVRLATSYAGTSSTNVNTRSSGGTLTLVSKDSGIYEFLTDRSGVFEISFELSGADGKVFHVDRVRIEIPSIPGLGG